jgi:hypothetical protein
MTFKAENADTPVVWKVVASHPDRGVLEACGAMMRMALPAGDEWSWRVRVDKVRAGNRNRTCK